MTDDAWKTIRLGPLCVAHVNRLLGLALAPGVVVFFPDRQEHAFGDEPHRHPICSPHLADVVSIPTHVGQQPKYIGKAFELVRAVASGEIVLLAIRLRPTRGGVYKVKTTYPIDRNTLERRIRIRTLFEI